MIKYVLRCSSNLPNMLSFQNFDFIVLDLLVLLVARRYRQVLIRCYTAWASKMWACHDNVNTAKLFMYIYILYSIVTSTLFFIIDRISQLLGRTRILTKAIDMLPTDSLFFGGMGIQGLEIAVLFLVVVFGKSEINIQTVSANTEVLLVDVWVDT